jgi:hypothetical protein
MTLQELKLIILDEIHEIISEPVVDPDEVKLRVEKAFKEYEESRA